MINPYLPDELIVYILSFINRKFINFRSTNKCICRTKSQVLCKVLTKNIYCHIHNHLDSFSKLSLSQNINNVKCASCKGYCINTFNYIRAWNTFCSKKCLNYYHKTTD